MAILFVPLVPGKYLAAATTAAYLEGLHARHAAYGARTAQDAPYEPTAAEEAERLALIDEAEAQDEALALMHAQEEHDAWYEAELMAQERDQEIAHREAYTLRYSGACVA